MPLSGAHAGVVATGKFATSIGRGVLMYDILDETEDDKPAIEALLDVAFGGGRFSLPAYRLRHEVAPLTDLCVVARDKQGLLAGTLRFWPVVVGTAISPTLLLGPIAVHPVRQGEGVGSSLIAEGLERAKRHGWDDVLLIGDLPYYVRFGFQRCTEIVMPSPTDPNRVLCYRLSERGGSLTGSVSRWDGNITAPHGHRSE